MYVAARGTGEMGKEKAKKDRLPPSDYVCAACKEGGHWVYDCAQVGTMLPRDLVPAS